MKITVAVFAFLILTLECSAQWELVNPLAGAGRGGLSADTAGHVYVAWDTLWLHSTANGDTWEPMAWYPGGGYAGRLCAGQNSSVLCGTTSGIYRSTTLGTTWETHVLRDTGITVLVAGADDKLYAGTAPPLPANTWRGSVVRSTDNGVSWTQCAPAWAPTSIEAIAATMQGTLFVAQTSHITLAGSIARSTDSGTHWTTVKEFAHDTMVVSLGIGPSGSIFAGTMNPFASGGTAGGILKSTDGGTTWNWANAGFPGAGVYAFSSLQPNCIFAATRGVYYSVDDGSSWHRVSTGLPDTSVYALAASARDLFAATRGSGLWRIPLSTATAVEIPQPGAPDQYALMQNYPNPFNPTTAIEFTVGVVSGRSPVASTVRLAVYDMLGREVAVLVDEKKEPGTYQVRFDASGLATGMYVYRLSIGDFVESRKMLIVR